MNQPIQLSEEDSSLLLKSLGMAIATALMIGDKTLANRLLQLANILNVNAGNPKWTPYEVEAE